MIHARADYNRIQDPAVQNPSLLTPGSRPIGQDEPVFLLRAQDVSAAETLRFWADENIRNGGDREASKLAQKQADAMDAWPCKKPADLAITPFAGWVGDVFRMRTRGGYETVLEGERAKVEVEVLRLMPGWHRVATEEHDDRLVEQLQIVWEAMGMHR